MRFLEVLDRHRPLAAPGAYDALSARVIERAGFPLVYLTGLGNEASDLGYPDLGLTTATELARRAGNVVQAVEAPVVTDADTGFGGPANVVRTVRLLEAAGVAALHLEDQTFPKRCGLLAGKRVVPAETFAGVVETALAARRSGDLAVIARTDARDAEGVDGVVRRLGLYVEAGAHAVMLGDPYTPDEYRRIAAAVPAPLVACAVDRDHRDRQPDLHLDEWRACGVRMVVYWHLPLFAALAAVREAVAALRDDGHTGRVDDRIAGYSDYAEVTDLARWQRLGEGER